MSKLCDCSDRTSVYAYYHCRECNIDCCQYCTQGCMEKYHHLSRIKANCGYGYIDAYITLLTLTER